MAIQIKHAFVSLKGDGTDATQVQPTNWNAAHAFTMATGNIVGRLSSGAGAAEEIPISAYMASILTAADKTALADTLGLWETGDVKYTFRSASGGWITVNNTGNTIGKTGSAASLRANDDTYNLYALIYAACSDAIAPVSGGRSGNSLTDFNAGKTLAINMLVGRSPVGAGGPGAGLTVRTLGQMYGEENTILGTANIPSHYHAAGIYDPTHSHSVNNHSYWTTSSGSGVGGGGAFGVAGTTSISVNGNSTGVRVNSSNGLDTTYSAGGGGSHNTVHPVVGLNVMVKL